MSLLDDVSIVVTPNGYKAGELYAVIPVPSEGSEEVTNGDFASATSWNVNSNWNINTILGVAEADGTSDKDINQSIWLPIIGKRYKVTFTVISRTQGEVLFRLGGVDGTPRTTTGTFTEYITATNTDRIKIDSQSSFIGSVDNVSVKEYTSADMDVTRATAATRVDESGLIADVLSNVPRIDYTGGGCPHILSEPQRTNLVLRSQEIDNASWSKSSGGIGITPVVTADNVVSPDGVQNAEKVVFDLNGGGSGDESVYSLLFQNYTSVSGTTYSLSCYLKGESGGEQIIFDFDSQNSNVVTLTNEWVRYTFSKTVSTNGSRAIRFGSRGNNSGGTYGSDNPTVYIWGCQLEESYATSYIPTIGSTVTRNKDQFTRDGIGSLINDSEGVLFVEMAALSDDLTYRILSLSDGTDAERIYIQYTSTTNQVSAVLKTGSATQANIQHTLTDETVFSKMAFKWKANDFALWIDGVEVGTDTSGSVPSGLNRLALDRQLNTNTFFGKVKQLQVYKTALTDAQLTSLTT